MATTMQDVADRAGVSIATVSFVVNGNKPVRDATKQRVLKAMKELGFTRNPVGAALARGRTRILALLYPALERSLSHTAVAFFTSASQRARARGYDLIMWPIGSDTEQVSLLAGTGLVDGVLLMEVQLEDPRVDALTARNIPFALIGRTAEPESLSYVDVDFSSSILEALARLRRLGHRSIAFIDSSTTEYRHAAFARAQETYRSEMLQQEADPILISVGEEPDAGRQAGLCFADQYPSTTAVVIMNEHAAPGFVTGLKLAGVAVPQDISVVSLGTSAYMAHITDPRLTYMRTPAHELGELGLDALVDRIEHPKAGPSQLVLACEYVEGESMSVAPE